MSKDRALAVSILAAVGVAGFANAAFGVRPGLVLMSLSAGACTYLIATARQR